VLKSAGNVLVSRGMTLIKNIKTYPSKTPAGLRAMVLCGFGGAIWQTRLLTKQLNKAGYDVLALDFSSEVLSKGDPKLLINLTEEVVAFAEQEAKQVKQSVLLVGISLGALMALNILRRSDLYTDAVMITGGDIAKVAHNIYGNKTWPQSYDELAEIWQNVNMYSPPKNLRGKRMLFVLPARDKLIDTQDVITEINIQNNAGNMLLLVTRKPFGHVGTIIQETILFPKRTLAYIKMLQE
jgi:pimeloyl-ACP methyl ester carboxylesterase